MSPLKLAPVAPPEDDVLAPLRNAPPDRPYVVAQLGQSLDGRIATSSGESRWINHDCALDHLHALRAHVDAVVVGVGTVLADDPRLNVRRVQGRSPARVIIDPSGKLPGTALCLNGDGVARYVVRGADGPSHDGIETIMVPRTHERLSPQAIVEALFARGLRRILIEGGAWTVSSFIAARAVDRLHVLVAPVILGSGKTGLSLPPIDRLADALRPATRVHILADGDVLFDCDLRGGNIEPRTGD
jgi:riboflavin-specific deaminase-like protein